MSSIRTWAAAAALVAVALAGCSTSPRKATAGSSAGVIAVVAAENWA
jgi:hypothetical protein